MAEDEALALLAAARAHHPPVPVVALTADASVQHAVAALRAGAVDFLSKPFHEEIFAQTVRRALGTMTGSNDGPRITEGAVLIGDHPAIRLMVERINQVADTDANVLIRGEVGTGKQMIARLVHASSARRAEPFVAVNLSELPESTADAELFGETGGRPGRIVGAQDGTLYLDEVSSAARQTGAGQAPPHAPGARGPARRWRRAHRRQRAGHRRQQPQPGTDGPRRSPARRPLLPPGRDPHRGPLRCASARTTSPCWPSTSAAR